MLVMDRGPAATAGPEAWREFLERREDKELTACLRGATHTGRPLGSDRFISKVEALLGRRLRASSQGWQALWPLAAGKSDRISTKIEYFEDKSFKGKFWAGPGSKYSEDRKCSVLGTVKVKVPAGTFKAIKIECVRFINGNYYFGTRYYYYAPTVGHFVKQVDLVGGSVTDFIERTGLMIFGTNGHVESTTAHGDRFGLVLQESPNFEHEGLDNVFVGGHPSSLR